jgi:hypothetical protein
MSVIDKLNKLDGNTKLSQVKAVGQEVARELKNTTPVKDQPTLDNKAIKHGLLLDKLIETFEWIPNNSKILLMWTIAKEFGGLQVFNVVPEYELQQVGYTMTRIQKMGGKYVADQVPLSDWTSLSGVTWHAGRGTSYPDDIAIVVPISTPFNVEKDTHTYSWATFEETSRATGQENYVEVSVSAEVGVKVPIVDKIVTFDVKGGVKTGEKHYKRQEERRSTRVAQQLSRTFIITKLGRNSLLYSKGVQNKPVANPVVVQNGYELEQKDASKAGPFWNAYDPSADQVYLGHARAIEAMQRMMDEISLEMARRSRGAYVNPP